MRCSTCGGEPIPCGRVCVCGGSGLHTDEVLFLRKRAMRAYELGANLTQSELLRHLIEQLKQEPLASVRECLLWQWIKQDRITVSQMGELIPYLGCYDLH